MKEAITGYKAFRMLIEGLFNIGFTSPMFREELIVSFSTKENKKFLKEIRDWIKLGEKFYFSVKEDRLGYWRRPHRTYYATHAQLSQIDSE